VYDDERSGKTKFRDDHFGDVRRYEEQSEQPHGIFKFN
jgi:hypothetical protein